MAREPFLPLFFGDFLVSTSEWEGEEQALYLLLLGHQWGLGSLPAEPRRVCKLARWDWSLFERCWPTLEDKFPVDADQRRRNSRLEEHRERSREIAAKRAEAGRAGGKAARSKSRQESEQLHLDEHAIASDDLSKTEANARSTNGKCHNFASPSIPSHPIQTSGEDVSSPTHTATPPRAGVARRSRERVGVKNGSKAKSGP